MHLTLKIFKNYFKENDYVTVADLKYRLENVEKNLIVSLAVKNFLSKKFPWL